MPAGILLRADPPCAPIPHAVVHHHGYLFTKLSGAYVLLCLL